MEKIFDFIKKAYPFIIVNLLGAAAVLLTLYNGGLFYALGFISLFVVLFVISGFGLVISLVLNIAAFLTVIHDKNIAGLILSLFGGPLGALIGVLANKDYKYAKVVIIIFNAYIWTIPWAVASVYYGGSHF